MVVIENVKRKFVPNFAAMLYFFLLIAAIAAVTAIVTLLMKEPQDKDPKK